MAHGDEVVGAPAKVEAIRQAASALGAAGKWGETGGEGGQVDVDPPVAIFVADGDLLVVKLPLAKGPADHADVALTRHTSQGGAVVEVEGTLVDLEDAGVARAKANSACVLGAGLLAVTPAAGVGAGTGARLAAGLLFPRGADARVFAESPGRELAGGAGAGLVATITTPLGEGAVAGGGLDTLSGIAATITAGGAIGYVDGLQAEGGITNEPTAGRVGREGAGVGPAVAVTA